VSPAGKRVAYIAYRAGDVEPNKHPPNRNVELRLMSSGGGGYKTIAELFGGQGTMNVNSWSPDCSRFAFVSYRLKG
jgi:Tol biopolymer transport system component